MEAEGGRHEEEVHPEEEVTMVTGTVSRCMMVRLRPDVSAHLPCKGWTWRLFLLESVRGRTAREQVTPERESHLELMEVGLLRGTTEATVHLVEADEAAGVLEEDQDRSPGEEDQHPEDHRGGAAGAGSP